MLQSELLEIIANGENSGIEFKRDDIRAEQLAKEVIAMANLRGGMIMLGVEDDGSISGIQRPALEEWVMDAVFGAKVHPMIVPFYEEIQIDDKRIAIVSFTQGTSKPYVLRHNGREDVYIRVGSTSRLASREQQARLFASGGILHPEILPVAGTTLSTLHRERLYDYLGQLIADPDMPTTDDGWVSRLSGLGFMVDGPNNQPVCSIAGTVLFSNSPRRYLRQSGIRLLAFSGESKTYQALLDDIMDGPLLGVWRQDEFGQRILAQGDFGLIERVMDKLTPFISLESDQLSDGVRRERDWHYPRAAVRELIINALAHRDWTRSVDIEIGVYSNRFEVISPGTLQNSMTIEKMLAGQRSPRNPLIVDVLRDYGYVDARGMGIRTKVIPLMQRHNQSTPEFELSDDHLKTTLFR